MFFKESLRACVLDESSFSIGRVKLPHHAVILDLLRLRPDICARHIPFIATLRLNTVRLIEPVK